MFNFAIISGFKIQITYLTLFYGIMYGLCCAFSIGSGIVTLRYTTVAFKMIFVGAFSLALNQLIGIFIFDEPLKYENIIRCLIRIVAAVIAFNPSGFGKKFTKKGIFWCIICVLVECFCTVVSKKGAMEPTLDENSWFFLTNFFLFVLSISFLLICIKVTKPDIKKELKEYGKKGVFFTFLQSASSNVWSLVSVALMSMVDLTYYSPVSSALSMIACFCVSKFILREPADKRMYIAVILSIIAVII